VPAALAIDVDVTDEDTDESPDAIALSIAFSLLERSEPAELMVGGMAEVAIMIEAGVSDAGMVLRCHESVDNEDRNMDLTELNLWLGQVERELLRRRWCNAW
jgi:hypothetical protein